MVTPIHTNVDEKQPAVMAQPTEPKNELIHVNAVEDVAGTSDENGVEITIAVTQLDTPIRVVFTEPEPVVALICILIHDYLKHFPGQTDTITLVREVLRVLDNPEDA